MDYQGYSHITRNEPVHYFLKTLNDTSTNLTDKQVTELAKRCLNIKFPQSLAVDPQQEILNSIKILMKDVVDIQSITEAQKELYGAIKGLNALLKFELNASKQKVLKENLSNVGQYEQQIKDIFLIKEAVQLEPKSINILHDAQFLNTVGILSSLYGRKKRKIDTPLIQSLIHFWLIPENRPLLNAFAAAAHQAREANLQTLTMGKIPGLHDKHNLELIEKHGALKRAAAETLENQDYQNVKMVIDELFNNRGMVTNTQVHLDGINLAFNSEAPDALSKRLTLNISKSSEAYQGTLEQLKKSAADSSIDTRRAQEELKNWEKLEGYRARSAGFFYEKSAWDPPISPQNPIKPVNRIVGFAVKEGNKRETTTTLDFTKALGEQNLNLTIKERELLSQLLSACDSAILKNPNVIEEWNKSHQLPDDIGEVLKLFANPTLPHLNILSSSQKEALVTEALRFGFEVNYHLADDLLNLLF
jgi:hypothetical protein